MPLVNTTTTRFANGITNVSDRDIFNQLPQTDDSALITDAEEFVRFLATDWSVGGVGTPTRAAQAGLGGQIRLTGSAASGDNSWLQRNNPNFQVIVPVPGTSPGKRIWFEARLAQIDDATNAVCAVGLQIAVAANNFLTPVNGVFFRKAAAQTGWELVSRAAGVETTTGNIFTAVAATPIRLQFFFDGIDTIWAAINSTILAKITPAALPSVLIGPTFGVQNGTAVARLMDVEQFYIYQDR